MLRSLLIIIGTVFLMGCSMGTEPVIWSMCMELPLFRERIEPKTLGLDTLLHDDTTKTGDTLSYQISRDISGGYPSEILSTDIDNTWHTQTLPIAEINKVKNYLADTLKNIKFNYSARYNLGKAECKVSFIDISSLSIPIKVKNLSPVSFNLSISIGDAWDKSYCIRDNIISHSELCAADSGYFKGSKIITLNVPAYESGSGITTYQVFMQDIRFLPVWYEDNSSNALDIKIQGTSEVNDDWKNINSDVDIGIQILDPVLNISGVKGEYINDKVIAGASVNIPILSGVQDIEAFRDKLILESTTCDFKIKFDILNESYFSGIDISCKVFDVATQDTLDSVQFNLEDVRKNKEFNFTHAFDKVAQKLPDSLGYVLSYTLKSGKSIFLDEDLLVNSSKSVLAYIGAYVSMNVKANLVWSVRDTIHLSYNKKIPSFGFSASELRLMQDKKLTLISYITNYTNLYGKIGVKISTSAEDTIQLINGGEAHVYLPRKGEEAFDSIEIDLNKLNKFSSGDSLDMQISVDIYPGSTDALTDQSYIDVDALVRISGDQSTEDLF